MIIVVCYDLEFGEFWSLRQQTTNFFRINLGFYKKNIPQTTEWPEPL
jgi:hypothetical protein